MKRSRAATAEDLEAIPEGKWVRFEGGIDVEWLDPEGRPIEKGFEISLAPSVARKLRLLHGTQLRATLRGTKLVLRK